jgi:hypothetical protein
MIAHPKKFYAGVALMVGFIVVLILIFLPIFKGQNCLDYLDSLYNSISKGSANYIPDLKQEIGGLTEDAIDVTLTMASGQQAEETALLLLKSDATARVSEREIKVSGSLGKILANCLDDAERVYLNDGKAVSDKYGYPEKNVLFNWWHAFKELDSGLKGQKRFAEAKMVSLVNKKAVETAYNYYKIEPQNIADRYGIILASLVLYVIYTIWYGFGIMYMFEGWGMKLEH